MHIKPTLSHLQKLGCDYAFYYRAEGQPPAYWATRERFPSASIIKVPILLAWVHLERSGQVSRHELCNLDEEPQVQGAGFSWLMAARQLPYQDVLLMMIALSDNLCTNLVLRRIGLERLERVFKEALGLQGTQVQRKLMDYEARQRGLDNWVSARDAIHFYQLIHQLTPEERAWVESVLLVNQDDALLKRNLPRDTVDFYHKTSSIPGVLHDWGYTRQAELFLFTCNVQQEPPVFDVFGKLGQLLLPQN